MPNEQNPVHGMKIFDQVTGYATETQFLIISESKWMACKVDAREKEALKPCQLYCFTYQTCIKCTSQHPKYAATLTTFYRWTDISYSVKK